MKDARDGGEPTYGQIAPQSARACGSSTSSSRTSSTVAIRYRKSSGSCVTAWSSSRSDSRCVACCDSRVTFTQSWKNFLTPSAC